jgi:hypothetical protein
MSADIPYGREPKLVYENIIISLAELRSQRKPWIGELSCGKPKVKRESRRKLFKTGNRHILLTF